MALLTGNYDIITMEHMNHMKMSYNAMVGNFGILALATGNYDIITMEHMKICTTPLWATAVTSTTRSTWPGLSSL